VISKDLKIPFFAKATIFFVGLIALAAILYIGKSILVPIVFATVLAIVLNPVVQFLVRRKINRVLAIIITMLLTVIILFGFMSLLVSQLSRFAESWPLLAEKFAGIKDEAIAWASSNFDIDPMKINDWIEKTSKEIVGVSTAAIGQTLLIFGSIIVVLFLIPVYIFMILFYEPILREFIRKVFHASNQDQVSEIVTQTKSVIQRYLVGLVIEAVLVAVLDISALLILGIQYAVLLGIIGAILNVIPYIGGLVAVALPMAIAFATKSTPLYALYVMAAYYVIQLIDNNYIVPKIVASKVKINALASIIVVFVGNALWGIPGMFLSIPLLAIVKVFFDHFETLKPWGFLLGDTMPSILQIPPILKIITKKIK
jgi:predicted PurR-regulated permease PerM